jgi:hypothetical protein
LIAKKKYFRIFFFFFFKRIKTFMTHAQSASLFVLGIVISPCGHAINGLVVNLKKKTNFPTKLLKENSSGWLYFRHI